MSETDEKSPFDPPRAHADPSRASSIQVPVDEPDRVWTVYVLFVVTLLAMILASVALVGVFWVLSGAKGAPDPLTFTSLALRPDVFIVSIWMTGVVLVAASISAAALSPVPWKTRLSLSPRKTTILQYVLAAIGLPVLSILIETVVLALGVEVSGSLKMITETIAKMSGLQVPMVVIAISIVPGFSEELMFRGYVQRRLTVRHGAVLGIALSSVLFGIMHMDPLHSCLTAVMGVYLGYVAFRFGSIWPAVAAHTLNNGVSALSVVLDPSEPQASEPDYLLAGVAAIIFVACLKFGVLPKASESPVNSAN